MSKAPMLDQNLRAMVLRERGDNRQLAQELIGRLSIESKRRLLQILQDMKNETNSERRKRKRGQFW